MTKPPIPELPGQASAAPARAQPPRAPQPFDLDGMSVSDLLDLRSRIDSKLPALELKDVDLEKELVLQLAAMQELQRGVLLDKETPANQLAQVTNAVQSALQNLVKFQADVYKSERIKKLEQVLIECIKELPFEVQNEFLKKYEQSVSGL